MTSIFDQHVNHVGWFDGGNLFDLNLNWVAFHSSGYLFSSATLAWLGPFNNGSFLDQNGKPVAWVSGSSPSGSLKPLTPLRPLRPLTPLRPLNPLKPLRPLNPLTPLGGWSRMSWQQWLG